MTIDIDAVGVGGGTQMNVSHRATTTDRRRRTYKLVYRFYSFCVRALSPQPKKKEKNGEKKKKEKKEKIRDRGWSTKLCDCRGRGRERGGGQEEQ